jgi:hypothetical protein
MRFYPGANPWKKRKQIENDDEKQKKKQEYEVEWTYTSNITDENQIRNDFMRML